MTVEARGCDEVVARSVDVIAERSQVRRDYTHLQFCNAPIVDGGKCARHLGRPNRLLRRNWRRFLRLTRIG